MNSIKTKGGSTSVARLVPELGVSDIEVSVCFYVNILGFEIVFSRPESQFFYLDLGGAQLMLEQENEFWHTGERVYPYGRGLNIQIVVDDVSTMRQRIVSNKLELFRDLETEWYRQKYNELCFKEILILDPDGYLLRFSEICGERNLYPV